MTTLALDQIPAVRRPGIFPRIRRAIRARAAQFYHYWFVECVEPDYPLTSMSTREWSDLPSWHPTSADE